MFDSTSGRRVYNCNGKNNEFVWHCYLVWINSTENSGKNGHIYPKYSDRHALTDSVDSNQGIHGLSFIYRYNYMNLIGATYIRASKLSLLAS